MHTNTNSKLYYLYSLSIAIGSRVWCQGGVEENIRRKTVSVFIHLVYNGDMKADTNYLVCVEKSELGW